MPWDVVNQHEVSLIGGANNMAIDGESSFGPSLNLSSDLVTVGASNALGNDEVAAAILRIFFL